MASTAHADRLRPAAAPAVPESAQHSGEEAIEQRRNTIEERILGAMDRAMGSRIDTGDSGKFHDRWSGTGRYVVHPEDMRLKKAIEGHVDTMFGRDRK